MEPESLLATEPESLLTVAPKLQGIGHLFQHVSAVSMESNISDIEDMVNMSVFASFCSENEGKYHAITTSNGGLEVWSYHRSGMFFCEDTIHEGKSLIECNTRISAYSP